MAWIDHVAASAPEIFLFLAMAIGTLLGSIRIRGFSLGPTACTLLVAVVLGRLGTIVIPPLLKSIFFGLFVFDRLSFRACAAANGRKVPIIGTLIMRSK